jgi:hypothetical protein
MRYSLLRVYSIIQGYLKKEIVEWRGAGWCVCDEKIIQSSRRFLKPNPVNFISQRPCQSGSCQKSYDVLTAEKRLGYCALLFSEPKISGGLLLLNNLTYKKTATQI